MEHGGTPWVIGLYPHSRIRKPRVGGSNPLAGSVTCRHSADIFVFPHRWTEHFTKPSHRCLLDTWQQVRVSLQGKGGAGMPHSL